MPIERLQPSIEPMWTPSPQRVANANLSQFLSRVNQTRHLEATASHDLTSMEELHAWSIENKEAFWQHVVQFAGIEFQSPPSRIIEPIDEPPFARWFTGASLNAAQVMLNQPANDTSWPTRPALIGWSEEGELGRLTFAELTDQVDRVAAFLLAQQIKPGDRVVGYLPNLMETVVACLASLKIGATWSSCSPDFGAKGVLERFGQLTPVVLFTCDEYQYGGKKFSLLDRTKEITDDLPSLRHIVLIEPSKGASNKSLPRFKPPLTTWHDILATKPAANNPYVSLPFDHPMYVLFSSGTTGVPKGIVHGTGGTLLQHAKELLLHSDVKPGDVVFFYTTCGWMMWNWLISNLMLGATVVLHDGSPLAPKPDVLFEMADQLSVTHFGAGAKYYQSIEKAGVLPCKQRQLNHLRVVLSTGSPLLPESFDFIYRSIKANVQLASISGGTDIVSCFALGNPIGAVYRGQLQSLGLGMDVRVFDETGKSAVGNKGELVCVPPFPSMPICFWNDPEGTKYRAAYFEHFPGVWRHGDWAEITPQHGMIIYGRSDATLNPGGVRIGTAEIYRQVETISDIAESVAVGQDVDGDVRIILFVRLQPAATWSDSLADQIRQVIRRNTTPRHVPAKIIPVTDIPRTVSGKITELAIREIIHGRPVNNKEALANPECLKQFEAIAASGALS